MRFQVGRVHTLFPAGGRSFSEGRPPLSKILLLGVELAPSGDPAKPLSTHRATLSGLTCANGFDGTRVFTLIHLGPASSPDHQGHVANLQSDLQSRKASKFSFEIWSLGRLPIQRVITRVGSNTQGTNPNHQLGIPTTTPLPKEKNTEEETATPLIVPTASSGMGFGGLDAVYTRSETCIASLYWWHLSLHTPKTQTWTGPDLSPSNSPTATSGAYRPLIKRAWGSHVGVLVFLRKQREKLCKCTSENFNISLGAG